MKKQYKALICVIVLEFVLLLVLDQSMLVVRSWIGNAVGTFIFLLPIQILLFLLSKDNKFTKSKRLVFKIIFMFTNVCYILGGIATFVERMVR
ncbi:MAG: hypothetical protein UH249_01415 [Acutalibacteraceae bacterium]|nr:hypothetical protein [Acutalibacteraceae bacterium]